MDIDKLSKKIESFEDSAQTESQQESASIPVRHHGIESVPDALENAATPSAFAELVRQAGSQPEVIADPSGTAGIIGADPHLQEKVNLPETFPGGKAIDAGLGAFSLPGTQLRTEPSHYGIDLSKGGINARDLIGQVLGIINQSPNAPAAGFAAPPHMSLYAGGAGEFVDGIVNWFKTLFTVDGAVGTATDIALEELGPPGAGEAMQLLNAPDLIGKVTGDATDGLRGVEGATHKDDRVQSLWEKQQKESGGNYVNPDGGPTPDIFLTPDQAMRIVDLLKKINVKPENADGGTPEITAEDLKEASPLDPFAKNPNLRFVADRNPDYMETTLTPEEIAGKLEVIQSAKGPDVDPELAPPTPEAPPEGTGPGSSGGIQ